MTDTGKFQIDSDGKLSAYAWPGGYPIIYVTRDSGTLCPKCANGENGSEASIHDEGDPSWHIVAQQIHWEGAPETCDHCNAKVESAYGDPEAEKRSAADAYIRNKYGTIESARSALARYSSGHRYDSMHHGRCTAHDSHYCAAEEARLRAIFGGAE